MKPLKIFLIRTYQSHWGQHSGINQFIKYMDRSRFLVKEHIVTSKRSKFAPFRFIKRMISTLLSRGGPKVYSTGDFWAEISAWIHVTFYGYDVVFYLDGEHSLNKLPKILAMHKKKTKPKIVAMFHQPPDVLHTLINTEVFNSIDHAIVLSRIQADDLYRFIPHDRISTLMHGIDVDYFQPDISRKDKDKFICLSVGEWLRDYDTVIAVAERMKNKYPDIEFHIVSSEVKPPAEPGNIYLHQHISDEELLHLYQRANLFFMPMLDATANNAILEALACGLPVITTRLPGIESYISEKEAFLIDPGNPDAYQNAILNLYNDRSIISRMSEPARARGINFSWTNFARQIEHIVLNA